MIWTNCSNKLVAFGKVKYTIRKHKVGDTDYYLVRYGLATTSLDSQKEAIEYCEAYERSLSER